MAPDPASPSRQTTARDLKPKAGVGVDTGFAPNPSRAVALDRRMHTELGASLHYLADQCRGVVAFDDVGVQRLVRALEQGIAHPPMVFGDYYALGTALLEDDYGTAEHYFSRLAGAQAAPDRQRVGRLDDPARCEASARYQALMTQGVDGVAFLPPPEAIAQAFEARFGNGMRLMRQTMPELAAEVAAIVREVVAVVGDPDAGMLFDGGSHFQLWGALFLNADHHPNEQSIVEVVAHESAHSLLFGFCTEEALVFNDDSELYDSPLRADPRPMDGIYHSTFVLARMHWAMSRLTASEAVSGETRDAAADAREINRRNFAAGYRVVEEHGVLSDTGAVLMRGAKEYMDSAG